MSCQGWKNRDTWNVALWLNNDEGLYNRYRAEVSLYPGGKVRTAAQAREVVSRVMSSTPDGANFKRVNWTEIKELLNGE